jgi:hypothetical protein
MPVASRTPPVEPTRVLRAACVVSVAYNVAGAATFAFPHRLGAPWGMPVPVPSFYTTHLALVVLLFAAVYAWLAWAPRPDRALVRLSAWGKLQFFAVYVGYWIAGELPGRAVVSASGDLVLGLIFAWWLWATRASRAMAAAAPSAVRAPERGGA